MVVEFTSLSIYTIATKSKVKSSHFYTFISMDLGY